VTSLTRLEPRRDQSHKGDFGRVLVVGGQRGMIGAVSLAARAALRAGAGLVTLACPEGIQPWCASLVPCATSLALECGEPDNPSPEAIRQIREAIDKLRIDVLAIGPGMGSCQGAGQIVRAAIQWNLPLVLDADGLNQLSNVENWPALRKAPLVLTPHPGEFSRLTSMPVSSVQEDRQNVAVQALRDWKQPGPEEVPLVLLLKGHQTVVTDGENLYLNTTGNPGMATGGAGDVLTGVIAALIGQMADPFQAACLGAWVHGRAGDLAASKVGEVSLIATDLIEYLGEAFQPSRSLG
jgi:NAD(P)H-hydrate epimerase